jgi:putative membrane protein
LAAFGATAGQDPGQMSAPPAAQASSDTEFATQAAQSSIAEVARAQMALQKASNEEVKQYAQKIIDDHTNANNQLKDLAAQKGMTLPTEISAEHKAIADRLSGLSGAGFDSEYMTVEVRDHEKAVDLFQNEAQNGADQELKSWAGTMTPHLQAHQQTAHAILAKITAEKPATSEQMQGDSHPAEQARTDAGTLDPQRSQMDPSSSGRSDMQSDITQDTQPGARTDASSDQAQGAADPDLPRSASPLPLVGLLGLLSLGAAAGARFYRTSSLRTNR